jgi:formylglycine-generating enzyme required for sulfatase activity
VPVGTYKANAFGLYDMTGNVYQWVEDCAPDPRGEKYMMACEYKYTRGAGWNLFESTLRSANRVGAPSAHMDQQTGFRVARDLN